VDIERFRALLEDPSKTQEDLVTMRANALHINAIAHVHAAEAALDARFPSWRVVRNRRGSEKDAYVWLIERFVQHYPRLFDAPDGNTLYVAKGSRTMYFARSLRRLFGNKQHLAADPNKYHRLSNGWYAKLVLSDSQKLSILSKFATVAGLKFGTDWDWNSLGKNSPHLDADALLQELIDAAGKP
jgi:hypothetical protein